MFDPKEARSRFPCTNLPASQGRVDLRVRRVRRVDVRARPTPRRGWTLYAGRPRLWHNSGEYMCGGGYMLCVWAGLGCGTTVPEQFHTGHDTPFRSSIAAILTLTLVARTI